MAFNNLNRLKYTNKLAQAKITFTDRGAPDDKTTIMGCDITGLAKGFFLFKSESGNEVHISMHRVLQIELEGNVIWKRRPGQGP